ncbi:MAG: GNAT family N-acetyltransferase [Verrucomicrobiota bacterium]
MSHPPFVIRRSLWPEEKESLIGIRSTVFVEEQGFPAEIDLDGRDEEAFHLAAEVHGRMIGTARLLWEDAGEGERLGHIGRVAVLKEYRGGGVGSALIQEMVAVGRSQGCGFVELDSQLLAVPFYERLGFEAVGEEFQEAGQPHWRMVNPL